MIAILKQITVSLKSIKAQAMMPFEIAQKLSQALDLLDEIHAFYIKNEEHPTVVNNNPPAFSSHPPPKSD